MIEFIMLSLAVQLLVIVIRAIRRSRQEQMALDARRNLVRIQARERSALRHWRTFCCQQAEQPGPHPSTPTYYGDLP